jgi:lipopolysaccharide/colanic/teichoic acid biosynthesis glycosyltransferase
MTATGEGSGFIEGTEVGSEARVQAQVAGETTRRSGQLPAPPVKLVLAPEYESDRARSKRLAALAAWMENPRRPQPALSPVQLLIKRTLDVILSALGLVLTAPLLAVIALAIRLDSRGPVLFHQERVTTGGRIFRMHKFRTMRTGADAALDTTRPFFKLEADPRLTRVGGFLRRFSLDELPQLWNVITGDMSIVGPRPLPADQVAANADLLSPRHEVPPGLTGWWQINSRSAVTPEEALRLDLFYIENWSVAYDLFILIKTVPVLLSRRGAY